MLLDAKPPKPPSKIKKLLPLSVLIPLVLIVLMAASLLSIRYWNIRQEHAVARFMTALEEGKYETAYKLWQPAASYSYDDFLHDWGERGDYGKIRNFEILDSESRGPTVIVTVKINGVTPPVELLVTRKTLGLAYSPF